MCDSFTIYLREEEYVCVYELYLIHHTHRGVLKSLTKVSPEMNEIVERDVEDMINTRKRGGRRKEKGKRKKKKEKRKKEKEKHKKKGKGKRKKEKGKRKKRKWKKKKGKGKRKKEKIEGL